MQQACIANVQEVGQVEFDMQFASWQKARTRSGPRMARQGCALRKALDITDKRLAASYRAA